jgi:DNA-binding FadR family transcriptional regulator
LAIAYVVADWGGLINAENIGRAQVDHINIMDALMGGQATRAELRMREHLENPARLIFDTY